MTNWQTRVVIETRPSTITVGAVIDQMGEKLSEDEILEVIIALDDIVETYDFTRRVYSYTRDILVKGGELPEGEE